MKHMWPIILFLFACGEPFKPHPVEVKKTECAFLRQEENIAWRDGRVREITTVYMCSYATESCETFVSKLEVEVHCEK